MPWIFSNDGQPYNGETHELLGKTYSGKTRTAESRRLDWVEEKPKPVAPSKPKPVKKKAEPKPRGSTAWD
jgi:hypothetical protein